MKCPKCQSNWMKYKAGFNSSGNQRYCYGECNQAYTPEPKQHGYSQETRMLAIRMYVEGSSYGSFGRVLKMNSQGVVNWGFGHAITQMGLIYKNASMILTWIMLAVYAGVLLSCIASYWMNRTFLHELCHWM